MTNEGFTTEAYQTFKYMILEATSKFTGSPIPKKPQAQQQNNRQYEPEPIEYSKPP